VLAGVNIFSSQLVDFDDVLKFKVGKLPFNYLGLHIEFYPKRLFEIEANKLRHVGSEKGEMNVTWSWRKR
jgi:hypothetical protein